MQDTDSTQADPARFPQGWNPVIRRFVAAYGNARTERWYEDLIYIDHGLPKSLHFDDRVLNGFARKAARVLNYICADCGHPGKPRFLGDGWAVRCASCHGRRSLVRQIDELLQAAVEDSVAPFDARPGLWLEHELPLLLRSCIPGECWRHTTMPDGRVMRYVAREDVSSMAPWFKRLRYVLQDHQVS